VSFDLIIIGGGINGAGIARDAASRGLRVCLVEQGDFCGATSRWSSRLIHGGLRYLEYAELGLVYESLHERETLLRTAPHLVRPLPLLVPIYRGGRRGRATLRAGMWLYDLLSAGKSLPHHQMLDRDAARGMLPGLCAEGLRGAARYYDAQAVFPERLVIENLLAARQAGAQLRSWTRAERVLVEAGRVRGVAVRDLRGGATETLAAPLVVNATGPWVDQLLGTLPGRRLRAFIGGSKGSHIVVDRLPGLADAACYAEAGADGRPFFIIPWNGMTLIGTTDIAFEGDPARVAVEPAEIDYLLAETARLFPRGAPARKDIRYAYVGVRPLPAISAAEQGSITRRHRIRHHRTVARGLYSVIGGKLTTYRHLAEEMVDRLARKLRRELRPCTTARAPLPGALIDPVPLTAELGRRAGLSAAVATRLTGLYGARAMHLADLIAADPALGREICATSHAVAAEIVFAFEEEMAVTMADCLMRRTMLGLGADLGAAVLPAALAAARAHLGWSAERAAEEERGVVGETDRLRIRRDVGDGKWGQ
jgi:glycerol-3-phosphate dehydrogenase